MRTRCESIMPTSPRRLPGVPRLPSPQLVSSSVLARNRPGPADSFSPSVPLTYASSLGPAPLLRIYPLPMPFLRDSSFLFSSPLSIFGLRSHLVINPGLWMRAVLILFSSTLTLALCESTFSRTLSFNFSKTGPFRNNSLHDVEGKRLHFVKPIAASTKSTDIHLVFPSRANHT